MITLDIQSKPLDWFEWYVYEQKHNSKFCGNVAHLYGRFEDAIKRMMPEEERKKIYAEQKVEYIKWVNETDLSYEIGKTTCQPNKEDLILSVVSGTNQTVNNRTKDKIVKSFFKHLVENKLEAKNYLQTI